MRRIRLVSSVNLVCLLFAAGAAQASLEYHYTFDQSNYAANPSVTVDVQVFLEEVVTGGDTSRLATDGLIGAGVRVRFDVPTVPSDPARVLNTADILPNIAQFDDSFGPIKVLAPGSYAEFTETVDLMSPPVLATMVAPGTFRIVLGSFRFTTASSIGQVTNIQALDIPGTSDTITGAGFVLDPLIGTASATISVRPGVSAVPEPSSWLLLSTGILGLLGRVRFCGPKSPPERVDTI